MPNAAEIGTSIALIVQEFWGWNEKRLGFPELNMVAGWDRFPPSWE